MGINKVQYGNTTLIDLTNDTVTADKLMQGYTAHDRSGAIITGTATGGGSVTQDQDGFIVLPPDGGGGGGGTWTWMGKNPLKVSTLLSEKVYLKDTGFATWTPSTTASVIVDSKQCTPTSVSLGGYDFILWSKVHSHLEYTASATLSARTTDHYYNSTYNLYSYGSNYNSMYTDVPNTVLASTNVAKHGTFYIDTQGNDGYQSMLYGVYVSASSSPSLSSLNNGVATITPNTQTISARCSNTYFTTDNASAVNQNLSYYEMIVELWRVDKNTSTAGAVSNSLRNMWLDGDIT